MATGINTRIVGEVASTQDEARRLAEDLDDGSSVLVVAQSQTEGRGRRGAEWLNAPAALACSLATRPVWKVADWGPLPLAAGIAACAAIEAVMGARVALKWPNDVVSDHGKAGGILVEASADLAVIGFGANLWWPDPPPGVSALSDVEPASDTAARLGSAWAEHLVGITVGPAADWGLDRYRELCVTLGATVTWMPDGEGEAVDVAPDGALVVRTGDGTVHIRSGEVHTVRGTTLPPESRQEA